MLVVKIVKLLKQIDIFSESVQFNANKQKLRKRTILGSILTISVFVLTGIYFVYQSSLYFDGKMDPKFRSQTFVSKDARIKLNNESIAFGMIQGYTGKLLNSLEEENNKIYVQYIAYYSFTKDKLEKTVPINVKKCENKELKGLYCFDFSLIEEPELKLGSQDEVNSIITFYTYKCFDIDKIKTSIPDDCADQESVNSIFSSYQFIVKYQTLQFNITAQEQQIQYRTQIFTYFQENSSIFNEFKLQSQITKVTNGVLIQSQESFSSLLSHQLVSLVFDREKYANKYNFQPLNNVIFNLDENQVFIDIQFPTFIEVLALCNSVLSVLLVLGIFCRRLAQNFIRSDILSILLTNIFSGTYVNILENSNDRKPMDLDLQKQTSQIQKTQTEDDEEEDNHNILPLSFFPNSSQKVFHQKSEYDKQDYLKDDPEKNGQVEVRKSNNFQLYTEDENQMKEFQISTLEDSQKSYFQESPINQKLNRVTSIKKQAYFIIKGRQKKRKIENLYNPQKFKQLQKNSLMRSIDNSIQTQNKQLNLKSSIDQANHRFESLNNKDLHEKVKDKLSEKNLRLIKHFFSSNIKSIFRFCKRNQNQKFQGLSKDLLNFLEKQVDESLDFFSLYKDILFLKKAIMLILSKDQLAALFLVGVNLETVKKNQDPTLMTSQRSKFQKVSMKQQNNSYQTNR